MPRSATRRITLTRIALAAWLVFVVVASVGPFLFAGVLSGPNHWSIYVIGGSVSISQLDPGMLGGGPYPFWRWEPSARYW